MAKYIDADELTMAIQNEYKDTQGGFDKTAVKINVGLTKALHIIQDTPAADVKRVIQCKDCKYWLPHSQFGFDDDNDEYHDYCELLVPDDTYYAIRRNAYDFCSRAERRPE